MRFPSFVRVLVTVAAIVVICWPVSAMAQSCALCYTQAAASGARMIQALKSGILILIIPPTLASVGLIGVLYHKRHQFAGGDEQATWPERNW
jgi:hypothetical protein